MAKAARAGVDHHGHLPWPHSESTRLVVVEDFVHHLHFEEVVARSQRPELAPPAIDCLRRDSRRIGSGDPPLRLEPIDIFSMPPAALHGPRGPALHHASEIARGERDRARGAHAGGNGRVQRVHEIGEAGAHVVRVEARREETYPTVDVEADRSRAHDTALGVGRHDAADGQAVALMDIRHGQRRLHDPGERRAIRELVERRFAADARDQRLVGDDEPRDAHTGLGVGRNAPEIGSNLLEGDHCIGGAACGSNRGWPGRGARGCVRLTD